MQTEDTGGRGDGAYRGQNSCVPTATEAHVENGSEEDTPEIRRECDGCNGSNLPLRNVLGGQQLRQRE